MQLNEFQSKALAFRLPTAHGPYAMLNLTGEVGELNSLIAKAHRDGPKPDHEKNVKKELGDILWVLAALCADHGTSLHEIAQGNLDKLSGRTARDTIGGSGDDR